MEIFVIRATCSIRNVDNGYTPESMRHGSTFFYTAHAADVAADAYRTECPGRIRYSWTDDSHVIDPITYYVDTATVAEREHGLGEGYGRNSDGRRAPVFGSESFWRNLAGAPHYARIPADDDKVVEFYESEAKAERFQPTRARIGRFLQRFAGQVLTPREISFFVEWQARGVRPADPSLDLRFATTPDDIIRVYQDGPSSCMRGDTAPQVYGAGDLAIAYLEGGEGSRHEGEPVARALCWPARKVYGRVYPETSSDEGGDLESRLRADGYVSVYAKPDGFNGARLLKIEAERGSYVMPYLDNFRFNDSGDHFTAHAQGAECCDSTGGLWECEEELGEQCDQCGDYTDPDDMTEVNTSRGWGGGLSTGRYCSHCVDQDTFRCEGSDELFSDFNFCTVEVHTKSGIQTWAEHTANDDAFLCERSGFYYADSDFGQVEVYTSDSCSETWEAKTAESESFLCEYDGDRYALALASDTFAGFPASLDSCETAADWRRENGGDAAFTVTPAPCADTLPLPLAA